MANTEDHDMDTTTTTTAPPTNLALRSSSSKAPSDMKPSTNAASASSSRDTTSDEDSEASTSDEEEELEEEEIATLKPGLKPNFSARVASGAPSLEDRLKSFLPQLAEANSKLEQSGALEEFSMEVVREDEPHIEMDLGLGVLEETGGEGGGGESEGEDDDGDEDGTGDAETGLSPERRKREKDVMGKLMGKRENQTAGIEEVG
jgi:hypothetical protein